jgi:hypothetical protein
MSMTYQQELVLSRAAARGAIEDLNARHNRFYTSGDRGAWIATFRHSKATFTRGGELFTDLRTAFDGGDGRRLVTVDHEISVVDGISAGQRCVALLYGADGRGAIALSATGVFSDELVYERGAWYFASRSLQFDIPGSETARNENALAG